MSGMPEIFELRHFRGDVAQHHGGIAALIEHIHAKPAQADFGNREIDFELFVEVLDLILGHQSQRRLAHGLWGQNLLIDGENLAFDFDLDRRVAGKEQVRCLLLDHELEQRLGVHHLSRKVGRHAH